jgi:hypothetical protein
VMDMKQSYCCWCATPIAVDSIMDKGILIDASLVVTTETGS